jgi:hypothetical protein
MKKFVSLDPHVLVVASVNEEVGDWSAYIGAVPGISHLREFYSVAEEGSKLPQAVAEALFPEFKHFLWRD